MIGVRLQVANKFRDRSIKYYHQWGWQPLREDDYNPKWGAYRKTHKFCSGYCCGNPRKWFGTPTIQEQRHLESFKDQLEELQ